MSSSDKKFPHLNLAGIHEEFIGLGHKLEDTKRQRKKVHQQAKVLQNRVIFFEKQSERTNRSIDEKKRHLEQLINIRNRREQDRRQKQLQQMMRQQEHEKLRMQSDYMRKTSEQNRSEAMRKLKMRNKNSFRETRDKLDSQFQYKKQIDQYDKKHKTNNFHLIYNDKRMGKQHVNDFKKSKNMQAIQFYHSKIQDQENTKKELLNKMKKLTQKEDMLIHNLQKSYMVHQKLKGTIDNAFTLDLQQLHNTLNLKSKDQHKSNTARLNSTSHRENRSLIRQFLIKTSERKRHHFESPNKEKSVNQIDENEKNPEIKQKKKQKKNRHTKKRILLREIQF